MTNTFYQTLINKKRELPFWMWWLGVWLVALVYMIDGLIRVCTFCIFMPNWGFNTLAWSMKMQIDYLANKRDKNN